MSYELIDVGILVYHALTDLYIFGLAPYPIKKQCREFLVLQGYFAYRSVVHTFHRFACTGIHISAYKIFGLLRH